uniref:Uncharacterized protein n=1 Tax=Rhizophora mucronata TaxID=61149 RepID=A0A2P2NJU2_RHIMU
MLKAFVENCRFRSCGTCSSGFSYNIKPRLN